MGWKYVSEEEFNQFIDQFPDHSRLMSTCPYVKPSYNYFKNKTDYMGNDNWGKIIASSRYSESDNSYTYRIWIAPKNLTLEDRLWDNIENLQGGWNEDGSK